MQMPAQLSIAGTLDRLDITSDRVSLIPLLGPYRARHWSLARAHVAGAACVRTPTGHDLYVCTSDGEALRALPVTWNEAAPVLALLGAAAVPASIIPGARHTAGPRPLNLPIVRPLPSPLGKPSGTPRHLAVFAPAGRPVPAGPIRRKAPAALYSPPPVASSAPITLVRRSPNTAPRRTAQARPASIYPASVTIIPGRSRRRGRQSGRSVAAYFWQVPHTRALVSLLVLAVALSAVLVGRAAPSATADADRRPEAGRPTTVAAPRTLPTATATPRPTATPQPTPTATPTPRPIVIPPPPPPRPIIHRPPAPRPTPHPDPRPHPQPTATPRPIPTATPRPSPTTMPPNPVPTPKPQPTPTATPKPHPTATPQPTATPRPIPTATPRPQPTATPVPPAPTPVPTPTAQPEPTPTPANQPTASPLPTPTNDGD